MHKKKKNKKKNKHACEVVDGGTVENKVVDDEVVEGEVVEGELSLGVLTRQIACLRGRLDLAIAEIANKNKELDLVRDGVDTAVGVLSMASPADHQKDHLFRLLLDRLKEEIGYIRRANDTLEKQLGVYENDNIQLVSAAKLLTSKLHHLNADKDSWVKDMGGVEALKDRIEQQDLLVCDLRGQLLMADEKASAEWKINKEIIGGLKERIQEAEEEAATMRSTATQQEVRVDELQRSLLEAEEGKALATRFMIENQERTKKMFDIMQAKLDSAMHVH